MTRTSRAAVGATGLALCTVALLVPAAVAVADTTQPKTKAQIERAERLAADQNRPTKAQVEQEERAQASTGPGLQSNVPLTPPAPSDDDAAAWQLALSAALGAAVTGGIVLTSRQVSHHRQAIAH
jgi:Flp pilus assembly protein TadB